MSLLEKRALNNELSLRIGYIYSIQGVLGHGTPDNEIVKFDSNFKSINDEYKSELILIDVRSLLRWETIGISLVVPLIIAANNELRLRGKPPIGIIGDKEKDPYDAVDERYSDSIAAGNIEWFESIEAYNAKYAAAKDIQTGAPVKLLSEL